MGAEIWLWLAEGLGYGAVNTGELLTAYPDGAEAIAADLGSTRLDEILTQKQAERLASTLPADFALRLAHADALGVTALPFDNDNYPDMLRSIHNPPPIVFVKGDLTLLNGQLAIGIVGARRPSAYGIEAVKDIGRGVAVGGAVIVSGLAAGLDSEAHKAALAVNGPTIACIAFGHDNCYPAANKKLMEVIEKYGAVLSEYPVGTTAEKPFFLQRNRLIAGISHGLVVAEARRQSGTMSTVNFATDYGRDVFAVPGSIFSELSGGTNAMIREGAYLAASASDILEVYGIELQEDSLESTAKQAEEGRPEAAPASPAPWQQNLARQMARQKEERSKTQYTGEKLEQQTLAEALQGNLSRAEYTNGRISSKDAMEAFRKLQGVLPPTEDSEIDARNRALDEMVAAVSDTVDFSSRKEDAPKSKKTAGRKQKNTPQIEPFPWNRVEHLSKEEMAKASTPRAPKDAKEKSKPSYTTPAPASIAPIGRVDAIGRVEPVMPVVPLSGVPQAQAVSEALQALGASASGAVGGPAGLTSAPQEAAKQKPKATPLPEARPVQIPPAVSLSGMLRTLQSKEEDKATRQEAKAQEGGAADGFAAASTAKPARAPLAEKKQMPMMEEADLTRHFDMDEVEATAADPLDLLSDTAKKAFSQLGGTPVSLNTICEKSGLSPGEAMAALTELELAGLSRQLAGRQFVIMQ